MTDDPTAGGEDQATSEPQTAAGPRTADEPRTADDENERENKGSDEQPWRRDEQPYAETAEQGGQPNLGPQPGTPGLSGY